MTEDDVKMLLDLQDGKCAICLLELEKPHIDHSYETGYVRGLLCNQCNTGLGMFRDNVDNLIRAMAYVGYSPRGTKFKANPERTSRHRRERQMQLW